MVSRFTNTHFSVFDCALGAVADALHAVDAFIVPDRLAGYKLDVVRKAIYRAFAAAYARIGGVKLLCLDKHGVKRGIYDAAFELVGNTCVTLGKLRSLGDKSGVGVYPGSALFML